MQIEIPPSLAPAFERQAHPFVCLLVRGHSPNAMGQNELRRLRTRLK